MARQLHSQFGALATGKVRIGISGWRYPPWRGVFYPNQLPRTDELRFASRAFSTIELNGSFYSLLRPSSYQEWYEATPEDFTFAVKGGRYITHMKRLRDVKQALANFFASGVLALREKLGPILWQLPPNLTFDAGRLRSFFELLPRSLSEVAELAAHHDSQLNGRSLITSDLDLPVRHTLEVRHDSFGDSAYEELLREYDVAACLADSAGLYPVIDLPARGFSYVRLHGAETLYASGYSTRELRAWAHRIRSLASDRDVYVYFDNDVKVRAPFDARNLARIFEDEEPLPLPDALDAVDEEPRTTWAAWRGSARAARERDPS
jgi:uncharacterized protein YecE (DUF72 family)